MSLIQCIDCGREVSKSALSCPNCGLLDPAGVAGECRGCGAQIRIARDRDCPECGVKHPLTPHRVRGASGSGAEVKELDSVVLSTGLLGPVLLLFGAFLPLVRIPFMGSQNYFQNGQGDGVLVAILAGISVVLVIARRPSWLILTGGIASAMVSITFIRFTHVLTETRRDLDRELAGNPFRGLADTAMQSIGMEWGWVVLILGAVITVAAGMRHRQLNP